jgi:hypothetical protein
MKRIESYLANLADRQAAQDIRAAIACLFDYQSLANVGAAILAGASPTVRYASPIAALVNGKLVTKATGNMPALNGGAIPAGASQMWIFTIDGEGTLGTSAGEANAVASKVKSPGIPVGAVPVAALYLTNGSGSPFTPATTALDTASVVTTYVNIVGSFYPVL